ncbi:MBOAT family protein [Prevotella sp. KH2C16]|uniref:MBOAT family O-acyltransferase n=1 Tax=Prevotella sp. KH2C16 TaxID=1855325 RepID=UPI0008EE91D8|nr:D-alanyl-lipoteichoic acid acyltransferase DltB, MBOAT superfamily [Prevotella sp. KH2C16]
MKEQLWDRIVDVLTYNPQEPMIFSSGVFLILFLFFSFIYMCLERKMNARLLFVTLFSYYFYYKSSGMYFFLLAVVTVSDYLIARAIYRCRENKRKGRWLVTLSLAVDLGLLGYFKYTNFFAGMLTAMVGGNFQPWDIFLPVGISFFTFQSLSYTIDVYRGDLKPLPHLLDYAFYVSFFPQLVAGPIVRARDFAPQIRKPVVITRDMFARGVYFILIGLFKKAVISDYISLNFVDRIFDNPTLYSGFENLLGVYGYALQIYCDFSGYSDMAIGIALLLGFHFPMNFNAPYNSSSITDFWRRWHISLSTWIRDYIYISLGGNRKGKIRQYVNLLLTMLLGGLWHGASVNFVVWGGIHGLALVGHKILKTEVLHHDRHYESRGWKRVAAVILTFHFVCLTWLIFRNHTFAGAWTMLCQIFGNFHPELIGQVVVGYKYVLGLMLFGYLSHYLPDRWQEGIISWIKKGNVVVDALLITLVIFIIIQVKSSTIQPFIYFQF